MASTDHGAEGREHLRKGLQFVSNGDIDNAVEAFFHAATAFDRAQESKQITALWEAIGNMLEPDFKEKHKEYFEALKDGKTQEAYSKWYQFPLVYRIHVASEYVWDKNKDPAHRQAWAYQWAGEHMEQLAEHRIAYRFFLKAAQKAEQTKDGKEYPDWPGKLWQRAVVNHICWQSSIENDEIRNAIDRMESCYLRIQNKDKRYNTLVNAYRSLRLRLAEAANLTEAEQFKRKENSALTRYYFHRKKYLRAVAEWVSGAGFKYFVMGFFTGVFFVFPSIYILGDFVNTAQGKVTYPDAVFYSVKTALNIERSEFITAGSGELLNVIETAVSWLGLSVFLWWLTKRLE